VWRRYRRADPASDPLEFPRRFADPADREAAAVLAAAFAFGNTRAIRGALARVFAWTGPHPAAFARSLAAAPVRAAERELNRIRSFRYRWIRGRDVVRLGVILGRILKRQGGVEPFFAAGIAQGDGRGVDLGAAITRFREAALRLDPVRFAVPATKSRPGVRYFFPSPRTSAAKRAALLLRWLVRPEDGLDLGLWRCLTPQDLVVPLDIHMFRIARRLGLTGCRTPGWNATLDLTRHLARLAPEDPVRYDFALSRLGILEGCPRHPKTALCELCELLREAASGP